MSQCSNYSIKLGSLCIKSDDFYFLIFNIIMTLIIGIMVYFNNTRNNNLQINLKNNFMNLGEGVLKHFYTPSNFQQKLAGTKKKIQSKSDKNTNNPNDKQLFNNELKCNFCSRSADLNLQATFNKLNQNSQQ